MSDGLPSYVTTTPLSDFVGRRSEEFLAFMLGERLGTGQYRVVYQANWDPDLVVKIEHYASERVFSNVCEWTIWNELKAFGKPRKWLAPCHFISQDGNFLVQRKVEPLTKPEQMPKKIPAFLQDCHLGNFGLYEGRVVCHDYAFTHLSHLKTSMEMAPWTGHEK